MTETVAIILLNWNGWKDTLACLDSLLKIENSGIGIFVCDNDSSDRSVEHIRDWARKNLVEPKAEQSNAFTFAHFHDCAAMEDLSFDPQKWPPKDGSINGITLIRTGGNHGYAGGNNVGLRFALAEKYDYYWLLNNDTEIAPDTLTHMLKRMRENPQIGICGSTLIYHSQPDIVQNFCGGTFKNLKGKGISIGAGVPVAAPIDRDAVEKELRYVNGASMLASRAFVESVGLLREDYFLYFEEVDWAERGLKTFKLGYAPDSWVWHKVGASIGTNDFGNRSRLSLYYIVRNRIWFCWRYHKEAFPFIAADTLREVLSFCRVRDWSRALLVLRATFSLPYKG